MEVYIPGGGGPNDKHVNIKTTADPPLQHRLQLLTVQDAQRWKKELRKEVRNLTMWKTACLQVSIAAGGNVLQTLKIYFPG